MKTNSYEIVWVFGVSAVGKETFIEAATSTHPPDELTALGWQQKTLRASENSIKWVGQSAADPITDKREAIFDEVKSLRQLHTVIFIKGQDVDLEARRPERLRLRFPKDEHIILYLQADPVEIQKRLSAKKWATGKENQEQILAWHKNQTQRLSELKGFSWIYLRNDFPDKYEILTPPKTLRTVA